VLHLHRIPHSVDVRRGGLHPVVHQDAALDPQLQPGRLGEAGVRRDADGQHHHVGGEGRLVLQQHIDPVTVGGKALHSAAQMQPHPFLPQLGVEEGGHVRVQGIQQLAGPLDHGDVDAQLPQVFHQLHADEAAAGTADRGWCCSMNSRIFRVSSTVRRVNRRSIPTPGSAGWVGRAPGERTSLS